MKKISSIFFGINKAILKFIYSIFKKELSEEEWNKWYQFIGFCLVGVSNFLVTFIVFNVCVYCFKMDPLLANVPAFFLSVLNAFFWNNKYVFKENDETGNRNNLADHVGIVEKIENGIVYTIEGNTEDSCLRRNYNVNSLDILGYGTPTEMLLPCKVGRISKRSSQV